MTLPPGARSSQRHWRSDEDEFVCEPEGKLALVEGEGETLLHAGGCAAFPEDTGNGHHLKHQSSAAAVYIEAGSRNPNDTTTCSDIDMRISKADGRFAHKDGTPHPWLHRSHPLHGRAARPDRSLERTSTGDLLGSHVRPH
jgi:uncharacterized cupin superfamily protein